LARNHADTPGDTPCRGYNPAMHAPEALAIDTIVALHRLHFHNFVIARLIGTSSAHVGQILFDAGAHERWNHIADVRADLPSALRESCARLTAARHTAPCERADRYQDINLPI
jgi:hypothetical protein